MQVIFRKARESDGDDAIRFVVRAYGHIAGNEHYLRNVYGAAPIERILGAKALGEFFSPYGVTQTFSDVNAAEARIAQLKAACDAVNDYWKRAEEFGGEETYPK